VGERAMIMTHRLSRYCFQWMLSCSWVVQRNFFNRRRNLHSGLKTHTFPTMIRVS